MYADIDIDTTVFFFVSQQKRANMQKRAKETHEPSGLIVDEETGPLNEAVGAEMASKKALLKMVNRARYGTVGWKIATSLEELEIPEDMKFLPNGMAEWQDGTPFLLYDSGAYYIPLLLYFSIIHSSEIRAFS